jgi:c-di-GMP-binding flagellar brake protein YcgR
MKKYWKEILKPGDKLKIKARFENLGQIEMSATVIDVSPRRIKKYIVINSPNASGQLIPLILGMNINIIKEEGVGIYSFVGVVLDKLNYEEIKTSYMISVPEFIEKTDRRNLKRLDINLEMKFKENGTNEDMKKGVTLDISGGGLSFISKYNGLKREDEIIVNIRFDNFELKLQRCKITRGPINKGNGVYSYSCKFLDIKTKLQDRIIGFIFRKEIEMSKSE